MSAYAKNGKWTAKVRFQGEMIYIGTFGSEAAARAASDAEIAAIRDGSSRLHEIAGTLSLVDYAAKIQVRPGTLKRWVHEGMPVLRAAGLVRVREGEADAWVREHHADSVAFARQSVVYVARRSTDGAVKIGWTSDVERRMRELRKPGYPVVLLAVMPGDKPNELAMHDRFAHARLDGEWFAAPENDVVRALLEVS